MPGRLRMQLHISLYSRPFADVRSLVIHYSLGRVRTNNKMLFSGLSRTCNDQIPGFSKTQNFFFTGLSMTHSIHKHGLHEVKTVHIQNQLSVYQHYSKGAEMQ